MKVHELIAKLGEFDPDLEVYSIESASEELNWGCHCCSSGVVEYDWGPVGEPYLSKQMLPAKKLKSGGYSKKREIFEVVQIDAL